MILDELPFAKDGSIAVNAHFRFSLDESIELYTDSRQRALQLLYKNKELNKVRPFEVEADFEEVAASCGYFSFSLLDLADEMKAYLEILDDLKLEIEERPVGRTWSWLKFWRRFPMSMSKSSKTEGKIPSWTQLEQYLWMLTFVRSYSDH